MELARMLITKPFLRLVAIFVVITALTLGASTVLASCNDSRPSGWYQGGGDSVPRDR